MPTLSSRGSGGTTELALRRHLNGEVRGLDASDGKRVKELEYENSHPKRICADLPLVNAALNRRKS